MVVNTKLHGGIVDSGIQEQKFFCVIATRETLHQIILNTAYDTGCYLYTQHEI